MKNLSNNLLSALVLASSLVAAAPAFAAGGSNCHFHGNTTAKESVVLECAKKEIKSLVVKAKIESTWADAKLLKAEIVPVKSKQEWKLAFSNPAAKDANKKTLYTFFSLNGNFIAANFTGE